MRTLLVVEHLTLDGVMQAPGDPDEDRRGGFEHGGWHAPYFDDDFLRMVGPGIAGTDAYLFGRTTYEKMARYWSSAPEGDVFGDTLNGTTKYVAATTLEEPLGWRNSTLLKGDVAEEVAALKNEPGGTICVLGSGRLVQTLIANRLVDELLLTIDPLVLGSGRRLFEGGCGRILLELVEVQTTGTGVIVATYRPDGDATAPAADRGAHG